MEPGSVAVLVLEGVWVTEVVAVHTPENAALDVVFIHGLDGDARNSWRRKDPSSFWPLWLAEDVRGVACGVP
jgi:hypothetical protein